MDYSKIRKFDAGGKAESIPFVKDQEKTNLLFDSVSSVAGAVGGFFGGTTGATGVEGMVNSIKYAQENPDDSVGIGASAGLSAMQTIAGITDQQTMSDKNFSAGSQAADQLVHGTSSALLKSGNPYAAVAGAALEIGNFVTKAGGQTVEGYNVNINNSGYGSLGSMESSSNRAFFGAGTSATERKLKKRNQQVRMALNAAELSEDQAFMNEARANSIQNVLQNNQIALAGGIETSILGG